MRTSAIDKHAARVSRNKTVLSMKEFAEQNIIIPGGKYRGRYFDCDVQPFTHLFFDTIDASLQGTGQKYFRFATTGPTQTGKTTIALAIPMLYHLFELHEDVGFGIPTIELSGKKWTKDLLPIIKASNKLRLQLPRKGRGSKDGSNFTGIIFNNGSALEVLPAGGGDKQRASLTMRVLGATEIDGYQQRAESHEGSVLSQMEARLQSYSVRDRRIYLECTTTVEEGAIWQEYLNGTQSRIYLPCPWCGTFVSLERENFKGWQDAETELQAMERGRFYCSECGKPWEEEQRVEANRRGVLRHTNDSTTFSFRWNAVNNLLLKTEDIAYASWIRSKRVDIDAAEREMCQIIWAVPYVPPPPPDYITVEALERAALGYMRGVVPDWADYVTVGVDMGKHVLYWCTVAWKKDGTSHIVDYGTCDCPSSEHGLERGMNIGLDTMHDMAGETGWIQQGTGKQIPRAVGCIDAGYQQEIIVEWCKRHKGWIPSIGQGHTQGGWGVKRMYTHPKGRTRHVIEIGEQWHLVRTGKGVVLLQHNVDFGKLWVQNKLQQPENEPGAMTLFTVSDNREHLTFLKHLTAEQLIEEQGQTKWIQERTTNHYLDALVLAAVAARKRGAQVVAARPPRKPLPTVSEKSAKSVITKSAGKGIRTRY